MRTKQLLGIDNIFGPRYNKSKYLFALEAPFKISERCCDVMKKKTGKAYHKETNRNAFLGTMANESALRRSAWLQNGCNAFDKATPSSQPLSFWTEQDILQYIKRYDLNIAEVYGDICYQDDDGMYYDNDLFNSEMQLTTTGVKRTGCVFCMFGITQDTDRFLKLKEVEPKKYDYVMGGGTFDENGLWIPTKRIVHRHKDGTIEEVQKGGLGYKFVIDWLNEHGGLNIKY